MFKGDKSMPVLNREAILAVDDIQIELTEVPEWFGAVYVKGMTGAERDRFEASVISVNGKSDKLNMQDIRAKLCAETICDESGKKQFSLSDVKALSKKSAAGLQRVFVVAQRLSGITDDDVEELAEGLEDNPFDGSASD